MWRYGAAFLFAVLAMTTIAALSILLSAFADNAIGPVISTMGVVVVLTIMSNLELPIFNVIKPYLFTTHIIGWKGFFDDPVPYAAITRSVVILVLYTVGFLGTTVLYFNKKDTGIQSRYSYYGTHCIRYCSYPRNDFCGWYARLCNKTI
jgi:ABC-2 type transport system permease protein